ncbi:hypothetical protein [Cupriavidus sp. CP313]
MEFIRFSRQGADTFGAVINHGVVDLGARLSLANLGVALREHGMDYLKNEAIKADTDFALDAIDAYRPCSKMSGSAPC